MSSGSLGAEAKVWTKCYDCRGTNSGPKIRNGDIASLLILSDKLQNCCWAMIELQSNKLDCTANMRQIFDRLPDSLQAKWRKSAMLYGERTGGKKRTLEELSAFITGELQIEKDPVYGRSSNPTARVDCGNRFKKQPFMLKPASATPITTMTAEIAVADASINQGTVCEN